ncbi:hypothetical protein EIP91_000728 [Steccherinum ochraceum]|uniref:Ubiquitin-like domain-containing protein n=1 Tax=Steccherinum ochraceum TaxID=92696 RepID=A0A4R0RF87_9APHY|nr:hypothetical protein EIP91_000728 [Steccherinum ochraceum]
MSSLDLRVELPTQSLSFHVQVPPSSTIRHVKEQIQLVCPGAPRADGQRIIWRGRFLKDDESVQSIWKSPADTPVIHLSVHPSAWSASPSAPTTPSAAEGQPNPATGADTQRPQPSPRTTTSATSNSVSLFHPLPGYPLAVITHHHNKALYSLSHGKPLPDGDMAGYTEARSFARSVLLAHGMTWPRVLDEDYPPADGSIEGVKYEQVVIDNSPFLSLTTPDAIPSPCQKHALNVLRTTYALLSIPTPDLTGFPTASAQSPYQGTPNPNLNVHLQQLGLPALRLAPNQNAPRNPADPNNPLVPEIRAIPIRALMVPLMMLTFRTILLMYFFSPSKRPLFGVVLSAWILYEAWNAFRVVLGHGDRPRRRRDRDGAAAGAGDNADAVGGAGQAARAGAPAAGAGAGASGSGRSSRSWTHTLLDKLANFQLVTEELALVGDPTNAVPVPTILHRVKTFCVLLATTLHPAVWDRRRSYIKRREGRVRNEASIRAEDSQTESNDQEPPTAAAEARAQLRGHLLTRHERRPAWVKEYIDRVLTSEWADDL